MFLILILSILSIESQTNNALPAAFLIVLKGSLNEGSQAIVIGLFTRRRQCPTEEPREWIDPDTGHRVIRLSNEPGSASLYFHQNPYTPDGKKLLITVPNGLATVDLKTRAIDKIVDGRVNVIIAGHKTGRIYYVKSGVVYATDPNTKQTQEIAKLPPAPEGGSIGVNTVNADETLLAGTITEGRVPNEPARPQQPDARSAPNSRGQTGADSYPGKGEMMEGGWRPICQCSCSR